MLRLTAPAKVNLFLRILAQESSGYHQLETLFCRLEFGDTMEMEPATEGIGLEVEGADIGPQEENLVYRAAQAFMQRSGSRGGVRIRLQKNIPMGAGLGGGSSDAATTLLGLERLFPQAVARDELLEIAGSLGSDVPFFLSPSSLALAWGRGERIQPLPPLPAAPVVLALPTVAIPTPWAYKRLAQERERKPEAPEPRLLLPESLADWAGISELAENDFEAVVFQENPALKRVLMALGETGSIVTLLSGSGSALFGVFQDVELAERAQNTLEGTFPDTRFVLTRTESRTR